MQVLDPVLMLVQDVIYLRWEDNDSGTIGDAFKLYVNPLPCSGTHARSELDAFSILEIYQPFSLSAKSSRDL